MSKASGLGVRAIARVIQRSASTVSHKFKRNATDGGAYRPHIAEGSYLFRRQRAGKLDRNERLQAFVDARLAEDCTPEQIAGRLKLGLERGFGSVGVETIYAWIYGPVRRAEKLWRMLPRDRARRLMRPRAAKDRPAEKHRYPNVWKRSTRVRPLVIGELIC